MSDIDIKEMREAAGKATQGKWGVWFEHALDEDGLKKAVLEQVDLTPEQDRCGGVYMIDASGKCPAITGCGPTSEANAFYLAAASPANVLALLDRLEAAEAERERTAARLYHFESLFDAAGKRSPVYAAVERILDEKSAWIARSDPEVISAIALSAVIAADLKSGASGVLADLHARLDRVEGLLKRAGEALSFYADTSKYPAPLTGGMGDLWSDCGQRAKAAIAKIEGEAASDAGATVEGLSAACTDERFTIVPIEPSGGMVEAAVRAGMIDLSKPGKMPTLREQAVAMIRAAIAAAEPR